MSKDLGDWSHYRLPSGSRINITGVQNQCHKPNRGGIRILVFDTKELAKFFKIQDRKIY